MEHRAVGMIRPKARKGQWLRCSCKRIGGQPAGLVATVSKLSSIMASQLRARSMP
jgi:hypothetical protein